MGKHKIMEYRERMDKALSSSTLTNEKSLKSLVKDQLNRQPSSGIEDDIIEDVLEKRTSEVSNFLEMLRSVAGKRTTKDNKSSQHNDWKLKQDNDEVRVMYREGPSGTPFHTLLVEGYVDAPIDVCLCVSWESTLYQHWWPQFSIPPFKINTSTCLQKVRTGEEISLVRVKVPWPLSAREAVLHYFELEYFEEELVVVVLNTIADTDKINIRSHGFTSDGIPETSEIVRIDLVGGFAIQKVNANRSYFRTIANLDIKVDFLPPSLINFISRQLIGSGFKLYQKAVTSVANGDEDFSEALAENPMYVRVRKCVGSAKILPEHVEAHEDEKPSENPVTDLALATDTLNTKSMEANHESPTCDIIEEEEAGSANVLEEKELKNHPSTSSMFEEQLKSKEGVFISAEVEWALGVLNRAIAHFQGSSTPSEESIHLEKTAQVTASTSGQNSEVCDDSDDIINNPETESINGPSDAAEDSFSFPVFSVDPPVTEVVSLRSSSTSIKQVFLTSIETKVRDLNTSMEPSTDVPDIDKAKAAPVMELFNGALHKEPQTKTSKLHNSTSNGTIAKRKVKKRRQCCFWFQQ